MPGTRQPPPRRIKTGPLAPLESSLYSLNALAYNNSFHVLDYEEEQLSKLEQMLSAREVADQGALISEILKRLKSHELKSLIQKLGASNDTSLLNQTYLIALIERVNRMRDEVLFNPTAAHWSAFKASTTQGIPYEPHCAYLVLKQRKQKKGTSLSLSVSHHTNESVATQIIQSMNQPDKIETVSLLEIKDLVLVPQIAHHSSLYLSIGEGLNTLYWVAWNTYYYTIGWFTYPFYLLGMAVVDQIRIFAIRCTQWSLETHPLLKFPITAIGSGTAFVGILAALAAFGVPVVGSAALATTGVVVAGVVNLLASADLKDKRLSPITLSKVFMVCCFAAVASAMMAEVGIQKLLLEFKYEGTPPANATLEGRNADAAFWGGIILAGFNCFTSLRSTYGASARIISDVSDPLSAYNLARASSLTKTAAIYLFTLITLSVALVYSVSFTEKLTGEEFSKSVKRSSPILAAICATNLTTAAIFINRTIDWIYEMFNRDLDIQRDQMKRGISGAGEWISMLGGVFMIGSFYLIAAFGNASDSAKKLWDNDAWEYTLSGLMAVAIFPSVWQTLKKLIREIEKRLGWSAKSDLLLPLVNGSPASSPANIDGLS